MSNSIVVVTNYTILDGNSDDEITQIATLDSEPLSIQWIIVIIVGSFILLTFIIILAFIIYKKCRSDKQLNNQNIEKVDIESKAEIKIPEKEIKNPNLEESKKEELIDVNKQLKNISHKNEQNIEPKNDLTNDQTLNNTNRQLLPEKNTKKSYDKIINIFTAQLNKIDATQKNLSIKEEIELMMKGQIKNDEESMKSEKETNLIGINNIICYTDAERDDPNDSFFNQNLEDIKNEAKEIEKDIINAKKEEIEIEKKIKSTLFKSTLKKQNIVEKSPEENHNKLFKIQEDALLTDFYVSENIEIIKS